MNKIISAEINKNRCYIITSAYSVHYIGDFYSITVNEKEHYFKIISMETANSIEIFYKLEEMGYYNLFSKNNELDIRKLINKSIEKIVSEEVIAKIKKESCW